MKCLSCGEYITSNQIFCSSCGKVNIVCPKCHQLVSDDDSFCEYCGNYLTDAIENAKETEQERKKKETEERKKKIAQKKQQELEKEMKEYSSNLIIECEGNKFKAIKELKDKYQVDNDIASNYISEAYEKINLESNNKNKSKSDSIDNIVRRNNYDAINSIKEVKDIYGYSLVEAKELVDNVIKLNKTNDYYIDPKGIKRTIIVSQSSRKKASSVIGRGLIGGAILGPVGLLAGASAKSKETTTFQVIYNSGKQETVTVKNGSWLFKEYCKYLDN